MGLYKYLSHTATRYFFGVAILCCSATIFANNILVGRYLSVAEKPQAEQIKLLQQQIQIKFPQNILTIGQAAQFILEFSGYRLSNIGGLNHPAKEMLNKQLPEVDRTFGPMTLEQGLRTLSGSSFYLLVDPVNREVGFKVKPDYRNLYKNNSTKRGGSL